MLAGEAVYSLWLQQEGGRSTSFAIVNLKWDEAVDSACPQSLPSESCLLKSPQGLSPAAPLGTKCSNAGACGDHFSFEPAHLAAVGGQFLLRES